ncbi:MAG TPA: zinc-binding dehydrogenase, partial [Mycobacteriales bacterium]|nr:zinc-binding dehydrogenase [Mycobacteriales bacterium]
SNATVAELARAAGAVNRLLAAGRLPVRVADVLPLSAAATAHRRMENPHDRVGGRLVLRP